MTGEAFRMGLITEDSVADALKLHRGDLFEAACSLRTTARELSGFIKCSPELQALAVVIGEIKCSPEYEKLNRAQFEKRANDLSVAYRLEAIEEIHKLATLPVDENAAMMDVKLRAATQLRGPSQSSDSIGMDAILGELHSDYANSARRIKEIRAVQITFEGPDFLS